MIKLAILALFGYLGWRVWRRLSGRGARQGVEERRGPESRLVFDPQCRTYVPEQSAERISVRGRMVYFCSPECRQAYLEKTERDKA